MMAAGLGYVDTARVLIDGGADISFQGDTGYTALILTAVRFHEFRDIFTYGNYGQMAQMIEYSDHGFGQQYEVAELLLEAGCETDTKATMYDEMSMLDGPTALWYAIENTNVELVRSLLEHGADPNVGGSTYMIATGRGNSEITELLQSHDMQVDDETAYILLNSAIYRGDSERVTELLENGADPNLIISPEGDTPIIRAANGGYVDIVNILLEAGADPSYEREISYPLPDNPGYSNRGYSSALMLAVRGNNLNMVRTLVNAGADLETYYINSHTPLMLASGIGNPEMVEFLIESGADVTKTTDYGDTALMCTVMEYGDFLTEFYYPREYTGDTDEIDNRNPARVVELLLDGGCDPGLVNDDGETVYSIAVDSDHDEVVLVLEEYQHPDP
jgi:ankyrin repeat protein